MADLTSKDVVLLACPFCGGSVEVGHYHPDLGPSSCFVKCWCGARGTEHQYQHGDHKEAIAKAAASWNRRTVETQPATHAVRENNELSANNEAQPAASKQPSNLPQLLRDAERRVHEHVWGDRRAIVSIPADVSRDVDILLLTAAEEIEWLRPAAESWESHVAAEERKATMRQDETSGKQPDWEAEYKKLAGVYSRTGLEDFIAKHWPGNKLVDVSAEEPRETIGLICYNPCEKHKGMSFTMTIGTPAVLVRTVCPHCEPIRPEEPSEANSLKCVSAGCANNCEKGNPYLCAEHARSSEKASDELRALYNATVDDLNKEQEV